MTDVTTPIDQLEFVDVTPDFDAVDDIGGVLNLDGSQGSTNCDDCVCSCADSGVAPPEEPPEVASPTEPEPDVAK
jgi:hypothetical protein